MVALLLVACLAGLIVVAKIVRALVMRRIARSLLRTQILTYEGPQQVQPVRSDGILERDHQWYAARQAEVEALGFRLLGDLEDPRATLFANPPQRTFMRILTDAAGTTAAIWEITVRLPRGKMVPPMEGNPAEMVETRIQAVEFSTTMSDGAELDTVPEGVAQMLLDPPYQHRDWMPRDTPPDVMWRRHQQRLADYQGDHPEATLLAVESLEGKITEYEASMRRKADFRRSLGWLAEEEIRRMLPNANDQFAAQIHKTMRAMAPAMERKLVGSASDR